MFANAVFGVAVKRRRTGSAAAPPFTPPPLFYDYYSVSYRSQMLMTVWHRRHFFLTHFSYTALVPLILTSSALFIALPRTIYTRSSGSTLR